MQKLRPYTLFYATVRRNQMTIYQRLMKACKEYSGISLTPTETAELAYVFRKLAQYKRTHNAYVTFGKKAKKGG